MIKKNTIIKKAMRGFESIPPNAKKFYS